jgi:tetratricopeptide (TPR) repeat protein
MPHRITKSRLWLMSGFLFLVAALSGCATQSYSLLSERPIGLPPKIELQQTPFFPQEDYQCGPAALAMTLTNVGITTHPDALVSQGYVPQRQGSLQVEMLAAGRRQGAVSVIIPARLDALLAEVANGNPVLVLQNLGLSWAPVWHYAVVIGYDLDQAEIILRSGTTERLTMPLRTFEHTWTRSGYWGMVTLLPGDLPKTPSVEVITSALIAFERDNAGLPAYKSYNAALVRWPSELSLLMGAGNSAFVLADYNAALTHFSSAATRYPDSAPALNNLALTLAHLGRFDEARIKAEQALLLGERWKSAVTGTLETIEILSAKANRPG